MFAQMLSHYCRKDTKNVLPICIRTQTYVGSISKYEKLRENKNVQDCICKRNKGKRHFSLCALCCECAQGNANRSLYDRHIERKEAAHREKVRDKESNPLSSRVNLLCFDVQRELLSLSIKSSHLSCIIKQHCRCITTQSLTWHQEMMFFFVSNEVEGGFQC